VISKRDKSLDSNEGSQAGLDRLHKHDTIASIMK